MVAIIVETLETIVIGEEGMGGKSEHGAPWSEARLMLTPAGLDYKKLRVKSLAPFSHLTSHGGESRPSGQGGQLKCSQFGSVFLPRILLGLIAPSEILLHSKPK